MSIVKRITIDEVMDHSHVRILISSLLEGAASITDDDGNWGEEESFSVDAEGLLMHLGLEQEGIDPVDVAKMFMESLSSDSAETIRPGETAKAVIWKFIKEGQVFFVGAFEVEGDRRNPSAIKVCEGKRDTLRIDEHRCFKDTSSNLYVQALSCDSREGK
ncbi:hypothetical protein ACFLS1_01885 [Verrucomicrobiota bacterium]